LSCVFLDAVVVVAAVAVDLVVGLVMFSSSLASCSAVVVALPVSAEGRSL
jgi:hypothetical protein